MAIQSFRGVSFILMVVFARLNVVLLQGPPAPLTPQEVSYYKETSDGVLGVRFSFKPPGEKSLTVTISYDTVAKDSADRFFTTQLNDKIFDKFAQCTSIAWNFLPCSTSKFDNSGQLACAMGKDQCTYDKVHSCVAKSLGSNQKTLGKFIICSFSGQTTQQCALTLGLDQRTIEQCVTNGEGAKQCDAYHKEIADAKSKRTSSEIEAGKTQDATTDFTHVLCSYIGQANLQCASGCT